ncbi:MAG: magnesium transporter [Steroidobacteraceae bacterium]
MSADAASLGAALTARFLLDFPHEASREIESLPIDDAAALLASQPPRAVLRTWEVLAPDVAAALLGTLPEYLARHLLTEAEPLASLAALLQLDAEERDAWLGRLDRQVAQELRELLAYPEGSAGRLMDARVVPLREELTVAAAVERLRATRRRGLRELFVVDEQGHLTGLVETEDLVLAGSETLLRTLVRAVPVAVNDLAPREELVEILQQTPLSTLPVVSSEGRLLGVIRQAELFSALRSESSEDLATMVGASADERALSPAWFAVKKRLPWLQINLFTAFIAASVVGSFQGLIAKFTVLAVLLPVVASQSGNTGAQALAVTMRGLVLREISLRHWPRVVMKEALTGLINGVAVAAVAALGVYLWSHSVGLVLIIVIAMMISMIAAGLVGALVPIVLRRLGLDPATASSIFLTTMTDVTGFFSFLGVATLLSSLLEATPK